MASSSTTTPNNAMRRGSPWAALPLHAVVFSNAEGSHLVSGVHSNDVVVIENSKQSQFVVKPNQRLNKIIMRNCENCELWVMDSAVITTQTTVLIDCTRCKFLYEDVDMRKIECYGVKQSEVIVIETLPLIEYTNIIWRNDCRDNTIVIAGITSGMVCGMGYKPLKRDAVPHVEANGSQRVSFIDGLKNVHTKKYPRKNNANDDMGFSKEEQITSVEELKAQQMMLTKEELNAAYDKEREEFEDSLEELTRGAKEVAELLRNRKQHVICYTGAGISTSANVPDYRGPQGIWTLQSKGVYGTKTLDFEEIRPTYAHYAITELAKRNYIHFVVSTNMDALHLRSGLPPHLISEQHGNSYKEICCKCGEIYYRQYDVTEDSDPRSHLTERQCDFCRAPLMDTIVNFAENLHEPDKMVSLWNCRKSTVALVMGTSMNVQPAASFPLECLKNDGKLVIVNLQKTPYDQLAATRIFAKTDQFMRVLLSELGIDPNLNMKTDMRETWTPYDAAVTQTIQTNSNSKSNKSFLSRVFNL